MSIYQDVLFLVGRVLISVYFLMNAMNHFTKTDYMTQYAESKGVPMARLSVLFSGILLAVGGISFLLAIYPTVGIISIAIFFIGVTPMMHDFWKIEDEQEAMSQQIQFMKNVAIFAAVLMFSLFTTSQWETFGLGITF